ESEQVIKRVSGKKINPAIARAIDQILGTSDACPCMRTMRSKKKERITDVLKEPSWSKHQATLIEAGIKSIGSTPILDADDNIVGALSIFYPDGFVSRSEERRVGR